MTFSRSVAACGIFACLLGSAATSWAQDSTGFLYVSDYGAQALDRFSYTYNSVTNTISDWQPAGQTAGSAVFINANIKEGLQGTASDIIVVNSGGNSLSRYTLNGTLIGNIPILNADNSPHTLDSVGNVAITPDGKYMYAPESGAGVIDKIDLATGKIVDSIAFAGAHDVLIKPDGSILAAAYSGSNAGSEGVWQIDSNLTTKTQIITLGDNGLNRPSGMSLSSTGVLYVQGNEPTGTANTVYEYNLDPSTGAATFDTKTTSSLLQFDFGSDLGPDGNLYIAALGSGQTHATFSGAPDGYVNGVYSFNTTTDDIQNVLAGYQVGTGPGSGTPTDGFESPKYLQFGFNFITAPDAGFSLPTPEPGSIALLGSLAMGGICMLARRRRRTV